MKSKDTPLIDLTINGHSIPFIIDSVASVNILDESAFNKVNCALSNAKIKIYTYGAASPLKMLGKFNAEIKSADNSVVDKFYVVHGCLLSYNTAVKLNLIKMTNQITQHDMIHNTNILDNYPKLFEGIGKLKNCKAKLHIDDTVTPAAIPNRRIPFHLRQKVETELAYLERHDIVERVEGPTPWVSPIVTPPKPINPEEVRICVDMRLPNKAIKRERHICPTLDDIIHALNGATTFSKLNLNKGYHQIELDEDSRDITTFSTHKGLYRYKRLNFGVCSAAELFQKLIQQTLEGISETLNISDDIIVYGATKDQHDTALHAVLQKLQENNLTLNKRKCDVGKTQLEFFGFTFLKEGIAAQEAKVNAIKHAETPISASEVRSLLGLANYCSRLIKNFATITQPLRELTHKNAKWEWTAKHDAAMNALKNSLAHDALSYFDPNKVKTELIVDASPVGLGAVLTQKDSSDSSPKIIAYASRSLTPVERRYSQTEREAPAIVWGCEHFHLYLYGSQTPFILVTDHKPLELIFQNPLSKPPARIER